MKTSDAHCKTEVSDPSTPRSPHATLRLLAGERKPLLNCHHALEEASNGSRETHLQRTASSDGFVSIQSCAKLFTKEFADLLFYCGDSRRTTNYLHCINIFFL